MSRKVKTVNFEKEMEQLAKRYNKIYDYFLSWEPSPQFREIMDKTLITIVEKSINSSEKTVILDLGCGHGTWIKYILEHVGASDKLDIVGLDLSEKRILLAKSLLAETQNVKLLATDFMKYDPAGTTFNIIFIADVLELIKEKYYAGILQKCYDFLSVPGYLVIIDKDRNSFHYLRFLVKRNLRLFPKKYRQGGTYEFIRFPSFKRLSQTALNIGFKLLGRTRVMEFHALILMKKPRSFQES
jgi:ubiquinone/menaquinone biosynthesis C-methylase UbiE